MCEYFLCEKKGTQNFPIYGICIKVHIPIGVEIDLRKLLSNKDKYAYNTRISMSVASSSSTPRLKLVSTARSSFMVMGL